MSFAKHWAAVRRASDETLEWYKQLLATTHDSLQLNYEQQKVVSDVYEQSWLQYLEAAKAAYELSKKPVANKRRSAHLNQAAADAYQAMRQCYVDKGFISILGGITLTKQTGSVKHVYIDSSSSDPVLDMMGSATTLNIGAAFPLFAAVDTIENLLGISENFALIYHASAHQRACFDYLRSLYPNQSVEPQIFSESSGAAVNSISISAATAYAEQLGLGKDSKLLAFQGTWSGGFGAAQEASSFGAADQVVKKAGLHWIDRCLPIPRLAKEEQAVLAIIREKIAAGSTSGIILEKIVGDAGIIELSDGFMTKMVKLFEQAPSGALPIIIDEIQAGNGRSASGYWSFEQHKALTSYNRLIITNGKSAGGGKPYAFALIPKAIATAAYPLSMLTTHSGNGPLGRAVTYARFITHPEIRGIKEASAKAIADELHDGSTIKWRGRHLNIGIIAQNSEELELLQNYLYIQYGILTGSFPATLRFQPNMIEYTATLTNTVRTIKKAMHEVADNPQNRVIHEIQHKIAGQKGGLNL